MTPIDTFERHLPSALTDLAVPATPDYLTDILGRTAATRQRPAWASIERWLPVDIARSRVPATRVPWRQLGILVALALLISAMLAAYVGTRPTHVPPPFGPAENGRLIYSDEPRNPRLPLVKSLQDPPPQPPPRKLPEVPEKTVTPDRKPVKPDQPRNQ